MPTARRNRRVPEGTLWKCLAAMVFLHALLMYAYWKFDWRLFDEPEDTTLALVDNDVELHTSCSGDVLLATAGRAAMCLAPWRSDSDACIDETEMHMWMDLSSCRQSPNDAIAAVAMVEQRAIEKLTPIDPEPLLEELKQQPPEQQPPPPPPPPQPQAAPPPPPPPPPAPTRPQQIVETVKPTDEKEPENARFLAEFNTKAEKQKVARGSRHEEMVAKSKPEELEVKQEPKEDPSVAKPEDPKPPGKNEKAPDVPGTLSMRAPGTPTPPQEAPQDAKTRGALNGSKSPVVADGFIPRRGQGAIEQTQRDPGERTRGEGGAGGGAPQVPDLEKSKDVLERIAGGGSVDHLEEIESGDETALTAKRWVYASFFNRMKRQVAQNWDPQSVWRRIDPDGTKNGFKTRITEVRVSLNPQGKLNKIVVVGPSGVSELDDEAVRAFNAAAPFPNPPDGLVKDNQITFAFSFYFEIGQPRTSWRVIRQ